jgi:hypothetical protein
MQTASQRSSGFFSIVIIIVGLTVSAFSQIPASIWV